MTMMIINPYRYVTAGGGTAPTFRTSVKKQNGGTSAGITTVTGDTIIVSSTSISSTDPATPTDSNSNSWTLVSNFSDSGQRIKIWIAQNATGGAGHTFTIGATDGVMLVAAYGGAAASSFDTDTVNTLVAGTGAITTAGTIDVAYNTVITVCCPTAPSTPITNSCATGYTVRLEETDNVTYYAQALADKNPNSTTAQSATWSNSVTSSFTAVIFVIKGV